MSPVVPVWETIFVASIIHEKSCGFVMGDEHGEGHIECECYVADLWAALREEHERLKKDLGNLALERDRWKALCGEWEWATRPEDGKWVAREALELARAEYMDLWHQFQAAQTRLRQDRYRVVYEWLAENMPRAPELCPYKVGKAFEPAESEVGDG